MKLNEINEQPIKVKLLDGKEYEILVPNIETFILIEDLMECSIENVYIKFNEKKLKSTSMLLYAMLKQRYPDMGFDDVKKLISIDNLLPIATVMFEQLGKAMPKAIKKEESQPEMKDQ